MPETTSSPITSRPPLADLTPPKVGPPSIVYVGVNDRLYVRSNSLASSPNIELGGRVLTPDGEVRDFFFSFASGTQTNTTKAFSLPEGYLLSVAVAGSSAVTQPNQIWVECGLFRGLTSALQIQQVLFQGYLSSHTAIGWPGNTPENRLGVPGRPTSAASSNPAAGAEAIVTVGTAVASRFKSFRVALVTSAVAANRQVALEILDSSGNVLYVSEYHAAHTASTTVTYNWSVGGAFASAAVNGECHGYFPDVVLLGGQKIQTVTANIDAGDDYGAISVQYETWNY